MKTPSTEELLADIRAKCRECCGGSVKLVEACTILDCRLWKHRCRQVGVKTGMFAQAELEGQIDMFSIAASERGETHDA